MPDLGPLPLPLVRQRAAALLAAASPDLVEVISYLDGGYSHANYRVRIGGEDYAVRLPHHTATDWQFEADWWQRLPSGLGVELLSLDTTTGSMGTRWVEGPLLVHAEVDAGALSVYLSQLHAALPDPVREYPLPELVERWLDGREQPDVVAWSNSETKTHTSWLRRSSCMGACHNDLNPWNIIIGEDRWYTLDWETVGNNDPLFDAVALLCGLGWSDTDVGEFVGTHLPNAQPLAMRLRGALIGYRLREYAWADAQLAQGNRREEIVSQRADSLAALSQLQETQGRL